jgi:serine/threonine protein kinase/Mn-containing catalase
MTHVISNVAPPNHQFSTPLDGRYQIVEILASRLWGRIYRAQDLRRPSQPECIIHHFKNIQSIPDYPATVRALFVREAAILEDCGAHPQIPQLLACFENDNGFYMVQESVYGHPLSAELQPGMQWTADEVGRLLLELLDPLTLVHHYGSVHGNLKPANVLRRRTDGRFMIIGFGALPQIQLSMMVAYGQEVPESEPDEQGYQAPEQAQGLPYPASDVYAVGMITIQALTGMLPQEFEQADGKILWQNHCPKSQSGLQLELMAILDRMVHPNLAKRYASAQEVMQVIRHTLYQASAMGVQSVSPLLEEDDSQEFDDIINTTAPLIQPTTLAEWDSSLDERELESSIDENSEPAIAGSAPETSSETLPPTFQEWLARSPKQITTSPQALQSVDSLVDSPVHSPIDSQLASNPPSINGAQSIARVPLSKNGSRPIRLEKAAGHRFQVVRLLFSAIANPAVQWGAKSVLLIVILAIAGWNIFNALLGLQNNPVTAKDSSKEPADNQQKNSQNVSTQALAQPSLVETKAQQKLQLAFEDAHTHQFTSAIQTLEQIPSESALQPTIQAKLKEYQAKQQVRAQFDLQRAYDLAVQRKFSKAIPYLRQVPKRTPAYSIAQKKIIEYTEKQRIRDQLLLSNARQQATQQNPQAALASITQVSSARMLSADVKQKKAIYVDQLNQQADQWLQQARDRKQAGDVSSALKYWQKVPIGTLAYAEAREKLAEFGQSAPSAQTPQPPRQNLNPGAYLRDVGSM